MTPEEKDLLLKDLCARLPYNVQGVTSEGVVSPLIVKGEADWDIITSLNYRIVKYGWKPYLRPMSNMTEEEKHKLLKFGAVTCLENEEVIDVSCVGFERHADIQDYLNACHFDYRGLIPMGLAFEALEGMYN